jgi:glycosyltransferase involved in cell wall biosynthesis
MVDLSIIVPIYNVEQYVSKCIESLFCQGLDEDCFEVIIVNDGTKDQSMEIVSNFVNQHSNIFVVNQVNQGLSVARNNGLAYAKGRYVMFVDSDDFIVENSLILLLPLALKFSVDVLIADFQKKTDEEIEKNIFHHDNKEYKPSLMRGREAFLDFFDPSQCYVWRTIYRKGFIEENQLSFIPNIYFEDVPFTIECYLKVEKALLFPLPFYIYRQRQSSIVSSVNRKKLLDMNQIITHLWKMLDVEKLSKNDYRKLQDAVFVTFSIEMWYLSHEKGVFPFRKDIIGDLKRKVPNLCFSHGTKQKYISFFYRWMPYTYLWIRSL